MRPYFPNQRFRGFTILELIVVIFILGILAAIVVPMAGSMIEDAKVTWVVNRYTLLKDAVRRFYADTGRLPCKSAVSPCNYSEILPWEQLFEDPGFPGWNGPYISRPIDPTDTPFYDSNTDLGRIFLTLSDEGFDLDGNGVNMTIFAGYWNSLEMVVGSIPVSGAKKIDKALEEQNYPDWKNTGIVNYLPGFSPQFSEIRIALFIPELGNHSEF